MMATQTSEEREVSAAKHLEDAVDDLNEARQSAQEELRSRIDSAISRAREALDDLRSDTEERAESVRSRAEEKAREWQSALEDATEDARRELGIRAVRAQRTEDALDAMADEIKGQKTEVKA
jgi:vacuolar-type H+-ATPase subunit H